MKLLIWIWDEKRNIFQEVEVIPVGGLTIKEIEDLVELAKQAIEKNIKLS